MLMLTKTLISIGIGVVIGLSPLRNSSLAKILITITGSWNVKFNCSKCYLSISWCPIPGKIVTVSALKATLIGCHKFA